MKKLQQELLEAMKVELKEIIYAWLLNEIQIYQLGQVGNLIPYLFVWLAIVKAQNMDHFQKSLHVDHIIKSAIVVKRLFGDFDWLFYIWACKRIEQRMVQPCMLFQCFIVTKHVHRALDFLVVV